MYYALRCPPLVNEKGEALMEIHNCFRVGNVRIWRDGKPPKSDTLVPNPIEIEFETYRGYNGPPRELVDVGIPVLSARLAKVLQDAGVRDIVLYPAILRNKATGEAFDYFAFRITALVAAADLNQSQWSSFDGKPNTDTSFTSLVLDESKTNGLLMFRLAENINALLVHDRVRAHILASGIDTLTFVRPDDWVHV